MVYQKYIGKKKKKIACEEKKNKMSINVIYDFLLLETIYDSLLYIL